MRTQPRSVDEVISDLERIAPAATPGLWWIDSHGHAMVAFDNTDIHTVFQTDPGMGPVVRHEDTGNLSRWRNDNDATWIASLPTLTRSCCWCRK